MALNCSLSAGYQLPCRSTGGIQEIYIGTYNGNALQYIFGTDSSIIGFTGSTVSFYGFQQPAQIGSYVEAGQGSIENGTFFYEGTLEMTLQQMTQALANTINTLGIGRWRAILLDQNGLYWLVGRQNAVYVTTSTPSLGKAFGDLNGTVITFQSDEPLTITNVSQAAALSVIVQP
jgi:hypothetical protein